MNTTFKLGDTVKIKSAGTGFPNMTITDIQEAGSAVYITCTWWNNHLSKYDQYKFIQEALLKS